MLLKKEQVFDQVNLSAPAVQVIKGAQEKVLLNGLLNGTPADLSGAAVNFVSSDPEILEASVVKAENGVIQGAVVGKKAGKVSLKAEVTQNGYTVLSNSIEFQVENAPLLAASTTEWTRQDVTLTVLSGIGSGKYEYSVGDNGIWQDYTSPVLITESGVFNVQVRYRDERGFASEPASVTVRIDKEAPVIAFSGLRSYSVTERVYVSCTAADALSGLAENPCSEPIVNGTAGYTLALGSHTVSVSTEDAVGNTAAAEGQYFITLTYEDLAELTKRFLLETDEIGDQGVLHSLLQKLQKAAEDGRNPKNDTQAGNRLEPYRLEVTAQAGKHLSADRADILIRLAQLL